MCTRTTDRNDADIIISTPSIIARCVIIISGTRPSFLARKGRRRRKAADVTGSRGLMNHSSKKPSYSFIATMTTLFTLRAALRSRQTTSRLRPTLQKCWYRGDSGDAELNLSAAEEALLQVAKPKSDEILERHTRLPTLDGIPKASLDPTITGKDSDSMELDVRRKRLIYRAKQRGWLEVDLLLGTWASQYVQDLNANELDQFEEFVNFETIDIYNIITLRLDVPEELKTPDGSGVVERIQEWARNSPLGRADPAEYKKVKTDNNLI